MRIGRFTPLLAAAALAVAAPAGCSVTLPTDAIPAPYSIAPAPSGSANQPAYVCTRIYQILTGGAARVANQIGSGDAVRAILSDMADQVAAERAHAQSPALKSAIGQVSDSLTAGSKQTDPMTYVSGGFKTVSDPLDNACN